MQYSNLSALAILVAIAAADGLPVSASEARVEDSINFAISYDPIYDDPSRPLTDVACSNGENGLITRYGAYGWETQGDMPRYKGGIDIISWSSSLCGSCWILQYGDNTVAIYTIDHAALGFSIELKAMNYLTEGRAVELGSVKGKATQVDLSICMSEPPPLEEL
ncbi:Fc.00g003010.m01.CDS01 [Cosmosporella sp. VM-42]